jgi:16S rRNA G966 N2-methylase RsmD
VLRSDAFAAIKAFAQEGKTFDVVFIDPPYSRELAKKALKTLCGYDILHPNSFVIFQHEKREVLPEKEGRLSLLKERKYGASFLTIYRSS